MIKSNSIIKISHTTNFFIDLNSIFFLYVSVLSQPVIFAVVERLKTAAVNCNEVFIQYPDISWHVRIETVFRMLIYNFPWFWPQNHFGSL